MSAVAILNLLFLFILVKRPISGSYTAAKFHSSTSIGGRDITVCAAAISYHPVRGLPLDCFI